MEGVLIALLGIGGTIAMAWFQNRWRERGRREDNARDESRRREDQAREEKRARAAAQISEREKLLQDVERYLESLSLLAGNLKTAIVRPQAVKSTHVETTILESDVMHVRAISSIAAIDDSMKLRESLISVQIRLTVFAESIPKQEEAEMNKAYHEFLLALTGFKRELLAMRETFHQ